MIDATLDKINKLVPGKWQWILNHEGFRRYFKNTGWMFFGQMFSLLVSFFIGAWLARYLGPENYGIFNYAIAFVGLFGFIASLGIDGILSRELIKTPEKRNELLGTSFRLKIFGGTLAFLLCSLVIIIFQTTLLIKSLVILLAFSFILQSFNVISIFFQSEVKSKNNVKSLLLATVISSLLKIVFILLNKGVIWLIAIYTLDVFWQSLGFIWSYKKYGLEIKDWSFNKYLAKKLLKNSWPLMFASAAVFIYVRIDQVMIGLMIGNREVGLYSAAVRLVEVTYFIPAVICSSLFPAIVNAKKNGEIIYRNRLKNFYILMTLIPIIIAIPVTLFAHQIINTLFGSSYLESIKILMIYTWSSLGLFLGFAVSQHLTSENLVKIIFWLNFSAMLINICLNLVLIPLFGLFGSAWATLISYLVVPIGSLLIRKKLINCISFNIL